MSILHAPRRAVSTDWGDWGARAYGTPERWAETKRRYWASRWTIVRRCVVCRAGKSKGGKELELNHLTYATTKIRKGWTPMWLLVPLCHRCHVAETSLARWLRRRRINFGEHLWATLALYLSVRLPVLGVLWVVWHFAPW